MIQWIDCFLCISHGRIDIGENYNKFFKVKNVQCPLCNGHGRLAVKNFPDNPYDKTRKGF